MIYDMHTHFLGGRFSAAVSDPEVMLREMDENQIELNLLLPNDGFFADCAADNDAVARAARTHPDRFVGMGVVNPRDAGCADEMKRCVEELGLIGIKLHPWLQAFSALDPGYMRLAEQAAKLGVTLFFHDGTPPYTESLAIAETARLFPELTVVLGHSGLNDLWHEALLAAKQYPNIWLCTCGCPFIGVKEIVGALDGERVMFGSDYPLANILDTRDRIRRIELLPYDRQTLDKVLYKNAQRFIRLCRGEEART